MRREPTRSEDRLWNWLRDRRFTGFKFRRQHVIDRYIVDFYCAELKLVIEVDGKHHETAWMNEYDSERLNALRQLGIEVMRIPNELLIRDSQTAAQCIRTAVDRLIKKS